jgi:hypothetical protein
MKMNTVEDIYMYMTDDVPLPYPELMATTDMEFLAQVWQNCYAFPTMNQIAKLKILDILPFFESRPLYFNPPTICGTVFDTCRKEINYRPMIRNWLVDFDRINDNDFDITKTKDYMSEIVPLCGRRFVLFPIADTVHGFEDDYELNYYGDVDFDDNIKYPYLYEIDWVKKPGKFDYVYKRRREQGMANITINRKYLCNHVLGAIEDLIKYTYFDFAYFYCNVAIFATVKRILRIIGKQKQYRSLLLSGDIETNPGPVLSTLRNNMCYNDPSILLTSLERMKAQGPLDCMNDISKLSKTVECLAPAIPLFMNFINEKTISSEKVLKETLVKVESIVDKSGNYGSEMTSTLAKALLICAVCTALCGLKCYKTAIATALITLFRLYELPSKAIKIVENELKHFKNERMQAQVFDNDIISICKILLTGLSCLLLNKVPNEKSFSSLTKKISGTGHALKGFKEILSSLSSIWNYIQEHLEDVLWQDSPVDYRSFKKRVRDWSAKVAKYCECKAMDELVGDVRASSEVQKLHQEGLLLKEESFQLKDRETSLHIHQLTTDARKLYEHISKTNVRGAGFRPVPYPIALYGESGVGKSALCILLACDLLISLGYKPEDVFHHMYARQSETEYWDGYNNNHDIVIYDDAFQRNDDASNPNTEIMETIRSVNVFPQHLHMACLEDKNTYLTAKSMIYSMNNVNVQLKSIAHPEAFFRRLMENCWQVVPAPEFTKEIIEDSNLKRRVLDYSKITDNNKLSREIYNLVKMQRTKDGQFNPIGDPITYEEFSNRMIKEMHESQTRWAQIARNLHSDMQERYLKRQEITTSSNKNIELQDECRQKAQVNDEEFFDCEQTTNFSDIIARGLMANKDLSEIETEILMDVELGQEYLLWKLKQPKIPQPFFEKWKMRVNEICSNLKKDIMRITEIGKEWFKNKCAQYPIFTLFCKTVGIATAFFSVFYSVNYLFNRFEPCDWDKLLAEPLTDETLADLCSKIIRKYDCGQLTDDQVGELWDRIELNVLKDYCADDDEWQNFKDNNEIFWSEEECERQQSFRREIAKSGDQKTQRLLRMKVELAKSGDLKTMQQHRLKVEGAISKYKAEFVRDINAYEMMVQASKTSLYRMQLQYNGGADIGNVIALKGYTFLMPHHYLTYFKLKNVPLDTICTLNGMLNGVTVSDRVIEFPLSEIIKSYGDESIELNNAVKLKQRKSKNYIDGILFTLSDTTKCHVHRNIIKHFITQDELGKLHGSMKGILATYQKDDSSCVLMTKDLIDIRCVETAVEIDVEGNGNLETYVEYGGFRYSAHTIPGDCGGLLTLRANSIPHKFLGYHISGCNDGGFSVKLTQEMIEEAMIELENKIGYRAQVQFHAEVSSLDCKPPQGIFVALGQVQHPLSQATRTAIEPSPLFGRISDPITKPALLKPIKKDGKVFDPLLIGLEKCGGNTNLLNRNDLDMIMNNVKNVLYKNHHHLDKNFLCRVFSHEEAIRGIDDDFIRSINRNTSPGYPFNSDPRYKNSCAGKQYWMGKNENFDFTSKPALELRAKVELLIQNCHDGLITDVICADTLKDERRPIAKVEQGKTRVFSACPMHFVVAFRRYFVGFASWVMHNRIDNESAVGINPYLEWELLFQHIRKKGDNIVAGDFSNFDGSLISQIMWVIFHIVDDWYKQLETETEYNVNSKIRNGLWIHIVNSVHVFGNNLVMWTHSQPSGNPFTVIINTIYNMIIVRLAYLQVCTNENKEKYRTMYHFMLWVVLVAYGDDNLIGIARPIVGWFNQQTIARAMKDIGHTYTDETKTDHVLTTRSIYDVSFLKRSFRLNDMGTHDATLDKAVIYEMINWVRRGYTDIFAAISQTIGSACREMSLYDKKTFDHFKSQLVKEEVHEFMDLFTYEDYRISMLYSDWNTDLDSNDNTLNRIIGFL